ncbi:unnamed protein product, partial [Gongylonema pulchrum]|uniref:BRCT domain-containing protein n=1 Tax=Gongylonema pulchrum TaxID=637853 RepID=A0A183EXD0_9BILA
DEDDENDDGDNNGPKDPTVVEQTLEHENLVEPEPSTSKTDDLDAVIAPEKRPEEPVAVKRICFTSTAGHDRDALLAMALELGAEICEQFDGTVTLLVCGVIVRNEKLLSSIARGIAVVDVDYVKDSHRASKWLEVRVGIFHVLLLCFFSLRNYAF